MATKTEIKVDVKRKTTVIDEVRQIILITLEFADGTISTKEISMLENEDHLIEEDDTDDPKEEI